MKSIQSTRSKTRKGVIAWLAKFAKNDTLNTQALYDQDHIAAVHVNRYTGEITAYETHHGCMISRYAFALQFSVVRTA